jgi:hypothetical protein
MLDGMHKDTRNRMVDPLRLDTLLESIGEEQI